MDWVFSIFNEPLPSFTSPKYNGETYDEFIARITLECRKHLFDKVDTVKRKYCTQLTLRRMLQIIQGILQETFHLFLHKLIERKDLWDLGKRVPEIDLPERINMAPCNPQCEITTIYDVCPCRIIGRTSQFVYCSYHRIPSCINCGRKQNNAWWELEFQRLITQGEIITFTDMLLQNVTISKVCIHQTLRTKKRRYLRDIITAKPGKVCLLSYIDDSPIIRDGKCRLCAP